MDVDNDAVENFNEVSLKKCLINLERKHSENQKLRIKHVENPMKYAASETELFAALDELQAVATQPELYSILIQKKALDILLSLISHENTDISHKSIGIIEELTDLEDTDGQEYVENLIEALLGLDIVTTIVSNLTRLDAKIKDEALAIKSSIEIIDNLIDYDSQVASIKSSDLINWMIKYLKKEQQEFDSVKLSIAELLSVLLINAEENKSHFRDAGAMDVLLQQVAQYRRVAPVSGEEHEFLEQMMNCICIATLNSDENRELFLREEGIDLIELVLREKREAVKKSTIKLAALKLLNHVITTEKNQDEIVTQCCERFIEVLGLRVLFPIFKNPKFALNERVKKKEYQRFIDEIEEHTTAILVAMLKHCHNPEYIQRILVKFAESNFEKFDRVLSLHEKYYRIVQNQDVDSDQDESVIKSSTHFTLRSVDYIILLACYLCIHYETYDPISGEKFDRYIERVLAKRPQLRHQLMIETRRHLDEVRDSLEEKNSLHLLLDNFEKISKSEHKRKD